MEKLSYSFFLIKIVQFLAALPFVNLGRYSQSGLLTLTLTAKIGINVSSNLGAISVSYVPIFGKILLLQNVA